MKVVFEEELRKSKEIVFIGEVLRNILFDAII